MGKVEDLEEGGRACQVMCNVSEGAQSPSRQQKTFRRKRVTF